jgi:hypothetical protein
MTDWNLIKQRYRQGETPYAISKSLDGTPSKNGIAKKAEREGWERISESTKSVAENLPIVRRARGSSLGKRSPENIAVILDAISQGATEKVAAALAGVSSKTITRWKQEDPKFAMEIHARRAQKTAERIQQVERAAEKNWNAAAWLLERDPHSREEFSKQTRQKEMPTVILRIDRSSGTPEGQERHGMVIDGSANALGSSD